MKKIYIPFILVVIMIAGFLGFQQINAATYEQPLYASMDAVPTADATTNTYQRDVIGNKEDAAASSTVSTTESLMAYVKQLVGIAVTSGVKLPTATQASIDAIEADTTVIGALGVGLSDLGGMSTAMQAEVNTEVDTALNTAVPATPTALSLNDILSELDGANTFDNTTDSLEAIRNQMDALNLADQVDLDAILLDTGTTLNDAIVVIDGLHDVPVADAGTNLYMRDVVGIKTDAAVGAVTTDKSIVGYVKGVLEDTGTTLPATLAIDAAAAGASYGHPNYLAVATGTFDTTGTWSTVASHEIATVTGMVRMTIIPEVVTTVASVSDTGTIQLGDEVATDSIIAASTLGSGLMAAGELWVDATLTRTILTRTQLNAIEIVVAGGQDIGYEVATNAISGGSMIFHIYWTPLDATGAVAAGAGGILSP